MKLLGFTFAAFFMYGIMSGHVGGALIALGMVVFTAYGSRQLRKRDIEFYLHPRSAKTIPNADAVDALAAQDAEAARLVL